MQKNPKILVVGSTGYLGTHVIKCLQQQRYEITALARDKQKLLKLGLHEAQIIEADVTCPRSMKNICKDIDVVISCLGITRQKDGLNYLDIDYQANLNVLHEAEASGVEKFIYISAFNAKQYRSVRLLKAKEKFASRLLNSSKLLPCVIRPNGFFSDMEEIYHMATRGSVFLFGSRPVKLNPIHGEDLAEFCIQSIYSNDIEREIGGPDILSMTQIAEVAFAVQNKKPRIIYLPDYLRRLALFMTKYLPEKWGGPAEFFLTAIGKDAIAPQFGKQRLNDHYASLTNNT